MPSAARNDAGSRSSARRKKGRATVGSRISRQIRPAASSTVGVGTVGEALEQRRHAFRAAGSRRSGGFGGSLDRRRRRASGVGRSTGCQIGAMPFRPEPAGTTRLNGSATTSGTRPGRRGVEDPDARLEAEQRPLALGAGTSAEGALSEEVAASEAEDRLDADIRVPERLVPCSVEHFPR